MTLVSCILLLFSSESVLLSARSLCLLHLILNQSRRGVPTFIDQVLFGPYTWSIKWSNKHHGAYSVGFHHCHPPTHPTLLATRHTDTHILSLARLLSLTQYVQNS